MQSKMRPSCVFIAFLSFWLGWPAVHGETLQGSVQMQVESFGDMLDANSKAAEVEHSVRVGSAGQKIVQVKVGSTGHFAHDAGSRHTHGKEKHHTASKRNFATLVRHRFGTVVRRNRTRASRTANQSKVIRHAQKKINQAAGATSKVTNQSTVIRRAPKRNHTDDKASKVTRQSTVVRRAPKRSQTVDMASKVKSQSTVVRPAPKRNQTVDMTSKVTNQSTVIRRAPRMNQTVQVAVGGSGHTQPNDPASAENTTGDMTAVHRGHARDRSLQIAVPSSGVEHDNTGAPQNEDEAPPSADGQDEMQHMQEIRPADPQRDSAVQKAAGAVQDTKHHHRTKMMRRAKDHRRNGQVALGTD